MAVETVRVHGLRELNRSLKDMEKDVAKEVRRGLKEAAVPVKVDAARLFAPVSAKSAAGYRVANRQRGVAVEQRLGRTTGQHPEFGVQQMVQALLPALAMNEERVIEGVERVLDRLADREGF